VVQLGVTEAELRQQSPAPAQRRLQQDDLEHGAQQHAPRHGVDADRVLEEQDRGDDRQVPEDRHGGRHGEALQ